MESKLSKITVEIYNEFSRNLSFEEGLLCGQIPDEKMREELLKRGWTKERCLQSDHHDVDEGWIERVFGENDLYKRVRAAAERLVKEATDIYDYKVSESHWNAYEKSRTYFKIIETRKNSKHFAVYELGYIDNIEQEYIPGKVDVFGKYQLSGAKKTIS